MVFLIKAAGGVHLLLLRVAIIDGSEFAAHRLGGVQAKELVAVLLEDAALALDFILLIEVAGNVAFVEFGLLVHLDVSLQVHEVGVQGLVPAILVREEFLCVAVVLALGVPLRHVEEGAGVLLEVGVLLDVLRHVHGVDEALVLPACLVELVEVKLLGSFVVEFVELGVLSHELLLLKLSHLLPSLLVIGECLLGRYLFCVN